MSFNPTYQNVLNFAIISEIAHTISLSLSCVCCQLFLILKQIHVCICGVRKVVWCGLTEGWHFWATIRLRLRPLTRPAIGVEFHWNDISWRSFNHWTYRNTARASIVMWSDEPTSGREGGGHFQSPVSTTVDWLISSCRCSFFQLEQRGFRNDFLFDNTRYSKYRDIPSVYRNIFFSQH